MRNNDDEHDDDNYDVIIVGGGLSGCAAAHSLAQHSITHTSKHKHPLKILLLEGTDALGGRVRHHDGYTRNNNNNSSSEDDGQGGPVRIEVGANWIHGYGSAKNPMRQIADRQKFQGWLDVENDRGQNNEKDDNSSGNGEEEDCELPQDLRVRDVSIGADLTHEFAPCYARFQRAFRAAEAKQVQLNQQQEQKSSTDSHEHEDISVSQALQEKAWPAPSKQTPLEKLAEWICLEYDYADHASSLSAYMNLAEECNWTDFGGLNYFVQDHRGMSTLCVQHLLHDDKMSHCVRYIDKESKQEQPETHEKQPETQLDVMLNATVVLVQKYKQAPSSDTKLAVHLEKQTPGDEPPRVFYARHVLVTVSIGVLQSNLISFQPDLSDEKWNLLRPLASFPKCSVEEKETGGKEGETLTEKEGKAHVDMCCYARCFLYWSAQHASWIDQANKDNEWRHVLLTNHTCPSDQASPEGYWPMVTKVTRPDQSLVLVLEMAGEQGRRIEQLAASASSNDGAAATSHVPEVVAEVLPILQSVFFGSENKHDGNSNKSSRGHIKIPQPDGHIVTQWTQSRYFQGAYSVLRPGCPKDYDEVLRRPEWHYDHHDDHDDDKKEEGNDEESSIQGAAVWLAGEACHEKYSGFMQGAYLSGVETAHRVLSAMGFPMADESAQEE